MRYILIAFFIFFMFVSAVFADFDVSKWQYRSRIEGGPDASEYVLLELPQDFFSHLKSDLSDLRIINEDGEAPYAASIEQENSFFTTLPARMFNLSSVSGDATTFVLDLGTSGTFHNAVSILTASENFRRQVEVMGSNDQASWRTLTRVGQIFDYTVRDDIKPVKVSDTTVVYPEATYRYIMVKIFDKGETPLKISSATVSRQMFIGAREILYDPSLERAENVSTKSTDLILDLGAGGIPHRSAKLEINDSNFSRQVSISDSDDRANWRLLDHNVIYKIETSKFSGSHQQFTYPESNKRYLRIEIHNGDNRPLPVGRVGLSGVVRSILFHYDPGKTYYAYLGNQKTKRPQYDIEKISQYMERAELSRVSGGVIEKNIAFVPTEPPKIPLTERNRYVLPVSLGVVVAVLSFLLLRVVSDIKKNKNSPPQT